MTSGDVICIVDADFVPARGYIDAMLGYFADPDVALVQAPQEFYNTDSFQHAWSEEGDWNEQSSFYRVIQPGKNHNNAVFWCGSPSMVRRAALLDVGGVATETVTEDLHTSLKLHSRGWRTVFHDEVVARGIAPQDYDSYILQRLRWAQGSMQVIRREWRGHGLSWIQQLSYIASTGTYFDAYRKLAMVVLIPLILLTDVFPVVADARIFFALWFAQFVVIATANVILGRGHYRYMQTEMFDFLKMFAFVEASAVLLFERSLSFKVTPKTNAGSRHLHPLLYPFVLLLAIYAVSVCIGVARLAGFFVHANNPAATTSAIVWGVLVFSTLSVVTVYGYVHISPRRNYRVHVNLAATVLSETGPIRVQVTDLTLSGLCIEADQPFNPGGEFQVELLKSGLVVNAETRSVVEGQHGGVVVGASLILDEDAKVALARLLADAVFNDEKPGLPNPTPLQSRPSQAA